MPYIRRLEINWRGSASEFGGQFAVSLGVRLYLMLNACGHLESVTLDVGAIVCTTVDAIGLNINKITKLVLKFSVIQGHQMNLDGICCLLYTSDAADE